MSPHALNIVVVSQDADIVREASWILTAYGYQVQAYREFSSLAATWRAQQPDFLLVDSDHPDIAMISQFPSSGSDCFTYKVLLHDMSLFATQVDEWKSYFNDVVSKPVNCGELFSRLRAGVRYLEFERQARAQAYCDESTGLLSKNGLLRTLDCSESNLGEHGTDSASLVLLKINYVDSLIKQIGIPNVEKILRDIADATANAAEDQAWVARIAEDVFAFVFSNQSLHDSTALVENIREEINARQFEVHGNSLQVTTTSYSRFFETRHDLTPEAIEDAENDLEFASMLGGAAVAYDEFDEDSYPQWIEKHLQSGQALSRLTASDVMTPFTARLSAQDADGELASSIRDSKTECVPYLDRQGRYAGVLTREAFETTENASYEELIDSPHEITESTSYVELADLFANHDEQLLVVLRGEKPLGYVTAESMPERLQPVEA